MPEISLSVSGKPTFALHNLRMLLYTYYVDRPTLMGANSTGAIADAGWQVRVIETVLVNTFQLFDDD